MHNKAPEKGLCILKHLLETTFSFVLNMVVVFPVVDGFFVGSIIPVVSTYSTPYFCITFCSSVISIALTPFSANQGVYPLGADLLPWVSLKLALHYHPNLGTGLPFAFCIASLNEGRHDKTNQIRIFVFY